MLIVIFVGLGILTLVLVLIRRRYRRRRDIATAPFNSGIKAPSNQASRTSLPRVREKDRMTVADVPVPPLPVTHDFAMKERGNSPDFEYGRAT
jgi:hypothetical protein